MLYFNAEDTAVFIGKEQEGTLKGKETLFLVGEIDLHVVTKYLGNEATGFANISQVYIGAGFLSKCTPSFIKEVCLWMDSVFDDTTVLTVEASYVDIKVLRECTRIDKWVYTAMMLGSLNPNYYQTVSLLKTQELIERFNIEEWMLEKIFVKIDMAMTTLVMALDDVEWSRYQDYGEDILLWSSESFDADLKVPMQQKFFLTTDPAAKDKMSLDVTKLPKNVPMFEAVVSIAPRYIFRSNPER